MVLKVHFEAENRTQFTSIEQLCCQSGHSRSCRERIISFVGCYLTESCHVFSILPILASEQRYTTLHTATRRDEPTERLHGRLGISGLTSDHPFRRTRLERSGTMRTWSPLPKFALKPRFPETRELARTKGGPRACSSRKRTAARGRLPLP